MFTVILCFTVDVACQVKVSKLIPRAEVALECSSSGLPTPHVPTWEKDDNPLTDSSNKSITINGRKLKMRSYTLKTVGKYTCRVTNGVTSDICSAVIPGTWVICEIPLFPRASFIMFTTVPLVYEYVVIDWPRIPHGIYTRTNLYDCGVGGQLPSSSLLGASSIWCAACNGNCLIYI